MAKGGGDASPESNAVTPAQEPAAPAAPVLTPGDRQLGVSWTAPGSNGAPITGYDVRYRAATGGAWTPHPHAGTSTGATVTGLTNDVSYEVQVRAANRLGTGEWSPSATGTPSVAAAWRARLERVNAALAPEAARAMASSAALAVSERIRRLASGAAAPPPSARSLTDLLERHGGALEEGTVPPRRMLAGTAFALPAAAADGGGGPATGFWASGGLAEPVRRRLRARLGGRHGGAASGRGHASPPGPVGRSGGFRLGSGVRLGGPRRRRAPERANTRSG